MVKKNTCQHLFNFIRESHKRVESSINIINKHVTDIKALYQEYEYMLDLDAKQYAKQWFAEDASPMDTIRPTTAQSITSHLSKDNLNLGVSRSFSRTHTDSIDADKDKENKAPTDVEKGDEDDSKNETEDKDADPDGDGAKLLSMNESIAEGGDCSFNGRDRT